MKIKLQYGLLLTIFTVFSLTLGIQSGTTAESNGNVDILLARISELEDQIENLSSQMKEIQMCTFGPFRNPDYDSDWIPIEPGKSYTLNHGQGVNPFIYILGWDDEGVNGYTIHQSCNGVDFWDTGKSTSCGIMWCCSNVDEICIKRDINDSVWDEFRLLVWKLE